MSAAALLWGGDKERLFGTTCMSIGKIAKMLLKIHSEFLKRSAFHELSCQKSSTLLIYKPRRMRYNNLARRKQSFRRKSAAQVGLCGISISWYQACKDAKRCTCFVRTEDIRERTWKRDRFIPIPFFCAFFARFRAFFMPFLKKTI